MSAGQQKGQQVVFFRMEPAPAAALFDIGYKSPFLVFMDMNTINYRLTFDECARRSCQRSSRSRRRMVLAR